MPNITHQFVSTLPDGTDPNLVDASDWNAGHVVPTGVLVGSNTTNVDGIVASSAGQLLRRNVANTNYEFATIQTPTLCTDYNFTRQASQSISTAGVYTFDLVTLPAGVSAYIFAPTYNVTGAVNNGSGLIRITTGTPHTFDTGMVVVISGVGGVAGANGTFKVTRVSYTQFDLQGTSFSGAYTAGGTVQERPQYLYLSGGGGTNEACAVVSVSGAIVSLYVASPKSGNYTITSATAGLQEALYSDKLNLQLPASNVNIYATFTIDGNFHPAAAVRGNNQLGSILVRGANFTRGDVIRMVNNSGPLLQGFGVYNLNVVTILSGAAIGGYNQITYSTRITNIRTINERVGIRINGSNRYFCDNIWIVQDQNYANGNCIAGIEIGDGPWHTNADIYFSNFGIQGLPPQQIGVGQFDMEYGIVIRKADGVYFTNGNTSARAGMWIERTNLVDTMNYILVSNVSIDNCNIFSLGLLSGNTPGSGVFQNIRFSNCAIQRNDKDAQPQIILSGNQFNEGGVQFNNCYISSSGWIQVYIVDANYVAFSDTMFRNANYLNKADGFAVVVQGTLCKSLSFVGCDWDYVPAFGDYSYGALGFKSAMTDFVFVGNRILRGASGLTFFPSYTHTNLNITGNIFKNASVYGIYFAGTTTNGVVITGNLFHNNAAQSIAITASTVLTRAQIDNNSLQETTPDTVASAATITLPYSNFLPLVIISGNTNISTINNAWAWKKVVLRFTGNVSLQTTGNIQHGDNVTAGESRTLQYDPSISKWCII